MNVQNQNNAQYITQLETLVNNFTNEIVNYKQEDQITKDQLLQKVAEYNALVNEATKFKKDKDGESGAAAMAITNAQNRINSLEAEMKSLLVQKQEAERNARLFQEERLQLIVKNTAAEQEINELKQQKSEVNKDLKEAEEKIKYAQSRFAKLEEATKNHVAQLTAEQEAKIKQINEGLQKHMADAVAKKQQLLDEKDAINQQIKAELKSAYEVKKDLEVQLLQKDSQIKELEDQYDRVITEYNGYQQHSAEEKAVAESQKTDLQNIISSLESEKLLLQNQFTQGQEDIKKTQSELKLVMKQRDEAQLSFEEMTKALNALTAEITENKKLSVQQKETMQKMITTHEEQMKKLKDEMIEKELKFKSIYDNLEKQAKERENKFQHDMMTFQQGHQQLLKEKEEQLALLQAKYAAAENNTNAVTFNDSNNNQEVIDISDDEEDIAYNNKKDVKIKKSPTELPPMSQPPPVPVKQRSGPESYTLNEISELMKGDPDDDFVRGHKRKVNYLNQHNSDIDN